MKRTSQCCAHLITFALFLVFCRTAQAQQQGILISTPEEIAQSFVQVSCRNKDRLDSTRALFERMQAPHSEISIEKSSGVENLVVRQQGTSEERIVIGAHYDLAELGCGAVDNWSGIVAVAHLYRTIRSLKTRKTVWFVAFGQEEKGLIGSKAMVNGIPKDEISKYCAMINIDGFGLAAPFALEGSSSGKLMSLAEQVSKQMGMSFQRIPIPQGDSDSSSFIARKIPAVTLSGVSNQWQSILHTTNDKVEKVKPESVYLGYRLALAMWSRIEEAQCESFR
jgi:hypothetical protein